MENLNILLSQIPVINYHKIEKNHDIGITTRTPKQFADDMRFLYEHNYHTITFKSLLDGKKLPENPLIITFDDAYQSFYKSAYPLLKKLNFSAVIYVPLDYLGRWNDWDVQYYNKRYMHISKDELLEIHNGGMEIGSHTLSHRMLTALDKNEAEKEIKGSKERLENLLSDDIVSISYPFSRFNQDILELTEKAGYSFGVASLYTRKIREKYQPLSIKRFNIYRIDGRRGFRKKVEKKKVHFLTFRDSLIQKGGRATNIHQLITGKGKIT
jgi:peptidoglycan/xylan/chitin deacetylase (PgdA/CDA1 family)